MTAAITTLRSTLATALTNDGVWSVFTFPPASPIANSCIINYADPAIDPENNQYASIGPQANFEVTLLVPLFDNNGNLIDMENYWVALMAKLNAAAPALNMKIGSFSAPTVSSNEMGQMLMSQISVSILTSWS
jgi:hypothetical protein